MKGGKGGCGGSTVAAPSLVLLSLPFGVHTTMHPQQRGGGGGGDRGRIGDGGGKEQGGKGKGKGKGRFIISDQGPHDAIGPW